jgi:hypothetical protein
MDMIIFPVHFDQVSASLVTNRCKDTAETLQGVFVKDSIAVLGHKDQMNMHSRNTISAFPNIV